MNAKHIRFEKRFTEEIELIFLKNILVQNGSVSFELIMNKVELALGHFKNVCKIFCVLSRQEKASLTWGDNRTNSKGLIQRRHDSSTHNSREKTRKQINIYFDLFKQTCSAVLLCIVNRHDNESCLLFSCYIYYLNRLCCIKLHKKNRVALRNLAQRKQIGWVTNIYPTKR